VCSFRIIRHRCTVSTSRLCSLLWNCTRESRAHAKVGDGATQPANREARNAMNDIMAQPRRVACRIRSYAMTKRLRLKRVDCVNGARCAVRGARCAVRMSFMVIRLDHPRAYIMVCTTRLATLDIRFASNMTSDCWCTAKVAF
jgi:hypothetical protein